MHSVKLARLQAAIDQSAEAISASRLGTIERVLVGDAARKTPNAPFSRTDCNRPVVFSGKDRLIGKLVDILITDAPMWSVRGEVVTAGSA